MKTNPTGLPERIHVLSRTAAGAIRFTMWFFLVTWLGALWILTFESDGKRFGDLVAIYAGAIGFPFLTWFLRRYLVRRERLTIAYDEEGIWRYEQGRAEGLVRWSDVGRLVKPQKSGLLILRRADGTDLLIVSQGLEDYLALEMLITARTGRKVEWVIATGLKYALE